MEKKESLYKYSIMLEIFVVRLCVTLQLLQTADTVGTQIKDNTISNDSGSTTYSEACCIDVASTIQHCGVLLHRQ